MNKLKFFIEPQQMTSYSKKEEDTDILERRLSIVDPNVFESNAKKIRENVILMRNREFKSELHPKEIPKVSPFPSYLIHLAGSSSTS